ncbi:unnamed protein product [Lymnaea stagnalis]|uniref:Immunoglobulin domain-containing protein n=1 Tax=Lymnaea stagnalis TaxID=6523 RepID=A0AAV2HKV8_LYMST
MEYQLLSTLLTVLLYNSLLPVTSFRTRLTRSLSEESNELVYFIVNGSRTLNVSAGMDVSFYCYINSPSHFSGEISGNGFGKMQTVRFDRGSTQLPLVGVSCEDTGRYMCRVVGDVAHGTFTQTEAFVQLNVPCPQKLRYPLDSKDILSLQSSPNTNTILTLEVYGYPQPTHFNLTQEMDSTSVVVEASKYSVTYTEWVPPNGLVALILYDNTYENSTTYVLTVGSPAGDLEFKFVSVKKYPKDHVDDDGIWIGVGVGVCCAVIIILIAVVVCCVRVQYDAKEPETDLNTEENFNFNQADVSTPSRPTLQLYMPKNTDTFITSL